MKLSPRIPHYTFCYLSNIYIFYIFWNYDIQYHINLFILYYNIFGDKIFNYFFSRSPLITEHFLWLATFSRDCLK